MKDISKQDRESDSGPPADVQFFGAAPRDTLGNFFAEAGSGDLDGDGIDELILSADQFETGGGVVYIYRGGRELRSTEDLASSAPDLTIYGPPGQKFFGQGFTVADLDGDGFGDLLVSSQRNALNRDDLPWGALYIFRGGPDFFSKSVRDADSAEHAILGSLTDINYRIDVAFSVGDVNADGRADLIIGSNSSNRPGARFGGGAGRVFILFGPENWPERLTLSRSTVSVEILGKPAEKEEKRAPSRLGRAVATGDINGDGIDDAVASAWWGGADMRGKVFIFFGRADWPETIDLDRSSADVTIENGPKRGLMGHALAVGDFNGDALDDLAFSSFEASTLGREKNGVAYVLFGKSDLPSTVDLESSPGFTTIHGPAGSRSLGYLVRAGGADAKGAQGLLLTGIDSSGPETDDHGFAALLEARNNWPDVIDLDNDRPAWSFRGGIRHKFLGVGAYMADFNGDGSQDLVIADAGFSLFRRPRCGLVYVFYGPFR